eukprot:2309454-Rhodomonas_salina.1
MFASVKGFEGMMAALAGTGQGSAQQGPDFNDNDNAASGPSPPSLALVSFLSTLCWQRFWKCGKCPRR